MSHYPHDPTYLADERERADAACEIPAWWDFDGTYDEWADLMNAAYPVPPDPTRPTIDQMRSDFEVFMANLEADLARKLDENRRKWAALQPLVDAGRLSEALALADAVCDPRAGEGGGHG